MKLVIVTLVTWSLCVLPFISLGWLIARGPRLEKKS